MTNVEHALAELRGHAELWDVYERRSAIYDPDATGDTFDPDDFDDGIDTSHPAPVADQFHLEDWDDGIDTSHPDEFDADHTDDHECSLGAACPYGPDFEYTDYDGD
jgi:hypothetical protein